MADVMIERQPAVEDAVSDPRLILAIATTGRGVLLSETLAEIANQTRLPDIAILCGSAPGDVDREAAARLPFPTLVLDAPKGLCVQRNAILDLIDARWPSARLLVFLDDDFVPARDFLAQAVRLCEDHPDVVLATGRVVRDGITTSGLSLAAALEILAADRSRAAELEARENLGDVFNVYGCNMVLALQRVREAQARFDPALPLYGWLEDVDFSRALARGGRIVRSEALRGVHLGTKIGRTAGTRFGYSQIANPLYLRRKGHMSRRRTFERIARNLIANLLRTLRPESWVDRRGRLAGNLIALRDLVRGRLSPTNILDLD